MMLAAVYCRVSTEKDDQINSLESQKKYFLNYIEKCPELSLFRIYADRGISGTMTKNRTRFNQMMEDAEKGLFQIIITKEVSRFSRNILDAVYCSRKLRALGIYIRFMNDGIDTSQPDAELRLSIMASLAQEESRKTSDRVKWGQTRRMEAGIVFGTSMLGYDITSGTMKIDSEGAEVVKNIYNKYLYCGLSAWEIAKELEKDGIKTYTGMTKWSPSVIIRILKNEKYCGDLRQKKTFTPDYLTHIKKANKDFESTIFIKNHHEGIVSRQQWEAVQKEIARRTCKKACHHGKGNRYPLSGKILCGCCGSPFVRRSKTSSGKSYSVWKCSGSLRRSSVNSGYGKEFENKGKGSIENKSNINLKTEKCPVNYQIRNDSLFYMLKFSFYLLIDDAGFLKPKLSEIITSAYLSHEKAGQAEINDVKRQLSEAEKKMASALDAYFSKKISYEELELMRAKYGAMAEEYKARLNLHKNLPDILIEQKCAEKLRDMEEFVHRIFSDDQRLEKLLGSCTEIITADENGKVRIKFKHLSRIFEFQLKPRRGKNCQNLGNVDPSCQH